MKTVSTTIAMKMPANPSGKSLRTASPDGYTPG
jgi:hypothetical protein